MLSREYTDDTMYQCLQRPTITMLQGVQLCFMYYIVVYLADSLQQSLVLLLLFLFRTAYLPRIYWRNERVHGRIIELTRQLERLPPPMLQAQQLPTAINLLAPSSRTLLASTMTTSNQRGQGTLEPQRNNRHRATNRHKSRSNAMIPP